MEYSLYFSRSNPQQAGLMVREILQCMFQDLHISSPMEQRCSLCFTTEIRIQMGTHCSFMQFEESGPEVLRRHPEFCTLLHLMRGREACSIASDGTPTGGRVQNLGCPQHFWTQSSEPMCPSSGNGTPCYISLIIFVCEVHNKRKKQPDLTN